MSRQVRRRRSAGFTLIELLVVLVILGLLAALVGPRVVGYLSGARADTARLQIEGFRQALDLYRLDVGRYPSDDEGLEALIEDPGDAAGWRGPYFDRDQLPLDPWGESYTYRADDGGYEITSLGSDQARGGDGDAADITSGAR